MSLKKTFSVARLKYTLLFVNISIILVCVVLISRSKTTAVMVPQPQLNTSVPTADLAKAYKHVGGKPCSYLNSNRESHLALLKHWHEYATRHGVEYIITCGTLLGQIRNKEAIPWEHDVDVLVSDRYYLILNATSDTRNFTLGQDEKLRLITQLELTTKKQRDRIRYNCKGKAVPSQSDPCAFVGPMARLIYRRKYIDIYQMIDQGKRLYDTEENAHYDRSDFYPLRQCTFMNMLTWCPKNATKLLRSMYGNFTKPSRVCKDGHWQRE